MFRLSTLSLCAAAALAVAVIISLPNPVVSQGKGGKDPDAQKKQTSTQYSLRFLDQERMSTGKLAGQYATLRQCLTLVYDQYKIPILVDVESFKAENPDMPDLYETIVEFPPVPETMTIAAFLRHALSKIPTKNATYVVMHDHLLVTTYERTTATSKLNEKVRGVFENQPLSSVLRELSERFGATIIIDNRAVDKANKTEVSATFLNDIPLAGALRVLTEMAELKAIVLDGAIMVTTPAHYDALRKEQKAKTADANPVSPTAPPKGMYLGGFAGGNPGVPAPLGQGLPGFPGAPGMGPDERILDPLWPYLPSLPGGGPAK